MHWTIINIGSLSHHELRNNGLAGQIAHATCTLIQSGGKTILVDPSLPGNILNQRLAERAGLTTEDITDVFLTNFRPSHRHGLRDLMNANWFISEQEREAVGGHLAHRFQQEQQDKELQEILGQEIAILQRCKVAPDNLAPQVDLFPLPGYTPGTSGLLLPLNNQTVLIAGDAVASEEHLEKGAVLRGAIDIATAQESFQEAVEIADIIVPGHGNTIINPLRQRNLFM